MRTEVTFGTTELTDLCVVSDLRTSLLPRSVSTEDVPGRDGSLFTGARLSPRTVTLRMTTRGRTPAAKREASRLLAQALNVSEPTKLEFSFDGGLYYLAVPESSGDGTWYAHADGFDVSFLIPDPVMYGADRSVSINNANATTINVGGTYPTLPTVSVVAARGGTGNVYTIMHNEASQYLQASVPTSSSHAVIFDCAKRVLTVDGATKAMPVLADWIALTPGTNTLQRTAGSGAYVVRWTERWV